MSGDKENSLEETLRERIEALHEKSETLKSKALSDGETNWTAGQKNFALDCSQPGSDVHGIEQVEKEISRVMTAINGPDSLAAVIQGSDEERARLQQQLDEAKAISVAMRHVQNLGEQVEAVDALLHGSALQPRDFPGAVTALVALEHRLDGLAAAAAKRSSEASTTSTEEAALPIAKLIGMVQRQCRMRRAEATASFKALWRFAVALDTTPYHPLGLGSGGLLLDVSVAGSASSTVQSSTLHTAQVSLRVHVALEGLVCGVQLQKPLPLDQLRQSLERLLGSSGAERKKAAVPLGASASSLTSSPASGVAADALLAELCGDLTAQLLVPMVAHALRDMDSLSESAAAPPVGGGAGDDAVAPHLWRPAVHVEEEDSGSGSSVSTGTVRTLVHTPHPPPLPQQQQQPSEDDTASSPPRDDDQASKDGKAASAGGTLRGLPQRVPNKSQEQQEQERPSSGGFPASSGRTAAAMEAAQAIASDTRLSVRLRRLLLLLRDLAEVFDFVAKHVLSGSLRYCARVGGHLLENSKAALASSLKLPAACASLNNKEAEEGEEEASLIGALVSGSALVEPAQRGLFRRVLFAVIEAVVSPSSTTTTPSFSSSSSSSSSSLSALELSALRRGVGELEQRLFEHGFFGDLPPTPQSELDGLRRLDQEMLATLPPPPTSTTSANSSGASSVSLLTSGIGLSSSSDELPSAPLSVFVGRLPATWASRMRVRLLERARRQMLLSDYHNSMPAHEAIAKALVAQSSSQAGGGNAGRETQGMATYSGGGAGNSTLDFPACQVTAVCAALLRFAHDTMGLACEQAQALAAATLYRTARELFDLFRAVVPQRHSDGLSTLPRLAALFHNDCLLLSHTALTLAHAYRNSLPAPLNKTATCVDLSPPLRLLGEQALQRQVAVQQVQLDDFLRECKHWVPLDDEEEDDDEDVDGGDGSAAKRVAAGNTAETAIRQCLFHLHHLANLWQPVLGRHVYRLCMARLLRHATNPLVSAVLSATDIAEAATVRLHALFATLVSSHAALFGGSAHVGRNSGGASLVNEAAVSSGDAKDGDDEDVEGGGGLGAWWVRLCTLKELMVWRLDDINEQLAQGTFRHFSADELAGLLEALFENSAKLKRTLTAVRQA